MFITQVNAHLSSCVSLICLIVLYLYIVGKQMTDLCSTGCVFSVTRVNLSADCPFEKLSAHPFITTMLSTIDNRSFFILTGPYLF